MVLYLSTNGCLGKIKEREINIQKCNFIVPSKLFHHGNEKEAKMLNVNSNLSNAENLPYPFEVHHLRFSSRAGFVLLQLGGIMVASYTC